MLPEHRPLVSYTIEYRFSAPPEQVFRAFTVEDEIKEWIWGDEGKVTRALVELESGGRLHIVAEAEYPGWPHKVVAMRGMVLFVIPNEKLVHTLHWDAPMGYNAEGRDPIDEVIAVNFEADGDGCLMRYTHQGIPDDGQSAMHHEKSVRATFDILERILTTET